MRRAAATVRGQCGWHLRNLHSLESGLYDHLAGELHARGPKIHPLDSLLGETTEAAVEIAGRAAEEQPADPGEHWIPEIAVKGWHSAGFDAAPEPVAHYQVMALPELFQEGHEVAEVVTIVGIAHDDVFATGRINAAQQSAAVAFLLDLDDARTEASGDFLAPVRAAVVGDYDLAMDAMLAHTPKRLGDTDFQGFCLIEARHHDGQL
jgi:hypothetical protein